MPGAYVRRAARGSHPAPAPRATRVRRGPPCGPAARTGGGTGRRAAAGSRGRRARATRPWWSTRIWSAFLIVESRCATTIVVRPAAQRLERVLDQPLGLRVDRRGRLVEDQDRRIVHQGSREGQQLALADREVRRRAPGRGGRGRRGSRSMTRSACTARSAASTCSRVMRSSKSRMLSSTVPRKRKTSCRTTAMRRRSDRWRVGRARRRRRRGPRPCCTS